MKTPTNELKPPIDNFDSVVANAGCVYSLCCRCFCYRTLSARNTGNGVLLSCEFQNFPDSERPLLVLGVSFVSREDTNKRIEGLHTYCVAGASARPLIYTQHQRRRKTN